MRAVGRPIRAAIAGLGLIAILSASISGCSSASVRPRPEAEAVLRPEVQAAYAEVERHRQHIAATARENAAKDAQIAGLQDQVQQLQWRLDAVTADYSALLERRPQVAGPVYGMLRAFASDHALLVSFDEQEGLLHLAADLAFAAGGDALTQEASRTLAALASLLSAPEAAPLELVVIGHSDAKSLSDPAAAQQLRADAWELSHRRALAVARSLASAGISLERITSYGEGDRRPVALNETAEGRRLNRRVELVLKPVEMPSFSEPGEAVRVTHAGN